MDVRDGSGIIGGIITGNKIRIIPKKNIMTMQ